MIKDYLILLLLVPQVFFGCTEPKTPLEVFAHNIISSIQNHDLKKFKDNTAKFEDFARIKPDLTQQEFDSRISDMFIEIQNNFSKEGIDISEYEIFEVREPYREYESDGFILVRFFTILKNEKGKYLKLDFTDCLKTEQGYLFADDLYIRKD